MHAQCSEQWFLRHTEGLHNVNSRHTPHELLTPGRSVLILDHSLFLSSDAISLRSWDFIGYDDKKQVSSENHVEREMRMVVSSLGS